MKQKRKVKNLLQKQESVSNKLTIAVLFITSWILCLGALVIFAMWKVSLAQEKIEFLWVNDNTESVYSVKFINPNQLSEDKQTVDLRWWSLYITPNPVVVNLKSNNTLGDVIERNNNLESNVYSNILWWNFNTVDSDNITVIAWNHNTVDGKNANVVVLWWMNNLISEWNSSDMTRTAVLVWWYTNKILNSNEWLIIIWWEDNELRGAASDAIILWWERNKVEW